MERKRGNIVVVLERDFETEYSMLKQMCSLEKCWICHQEKGDYLFPDCLDDFKCFRKVLKRLQNREQSFQSCLVLLNNFGDSDKNEIVNTLSRTCCSECGSQLQTLIKLELELEQIMAKIDFGLGLLVEQRKSSFCNDLNFVGDETSIKQECLDDSCPFVIIPLKKTRGETESPEACSDDNFIPVASENADSDFDYSCQSEVESDVSCSSKTKNTPKRRRKYMRLKYPEIQDPKNIICPECPNTPKKFSRLDSFRNHYRKVHLGCRDSYTCPYCPKTFTYKISLRSHVTKRHPEIIDDKEAQEKTGIKPTPFTVLECPECKRKLYSKTAWIEHVTMQCEVPPESLPYKVETFFCKFPGCEAKFYTKRRFKGHLQTHEKGKTFPCPKNCGKQFTRKFNIKMHLKRFCKNSLSRMTFKSRGKPNAPAAPKGDEPVFTCPHCARDFKQRACYKKHVGVCQQNFEENKSKAEETGGTVSDVDPRKGFCDICGKVLLRIEIPRHKERVHEKVKRWVCEICGKSFFAKFGWEEHLRAVHENKKSRYSKPGICELCGKDFRDSRNLSDHKLRVHFKVTRFRCQVCGKGFYHRNDFRKHFKSHNESKDVDINDVINEAKVVEK